MSTTTREALTKETQEKANQGKLVVVHPESQGRAFAASSATAAEEKIARLGRMPDGTKPVAPIKKFGWRPQVKNVYEEPEVEINEAENIDWLFRDQGKTTLKTKDPLPPRDDIIEFDRKIHEEELTTNLQWRDCPKSCALSSWR